MSVDTMMPAELGAGSGASTSGLPPPLSSDLIGAIIQAFEDMLAGRSGGSLGGAAAPQDSANARPFADGSNDGGLGQSQDSGGLGSGSSTGSAVADPSNAGPNAALNLSSELARLLSESYSPGSGASSFPAPADSHGGVQSGSSFDRSAPAPGMEHAAPSPPSPASSAASGSDPSLAGPAKSVDGATPGADTVDFKLVNTSGHDETIALTNAQDQKFDQETLKAGHSADVLLSANDPNTKSMREVLQKPDGSSQNTDAKIGESNIQDVNGHAVVSNDISNNNFVGVSGTDGKNVGGTQMTFSDDKGLRTGDNTANPAYRNSIDDAVAMKMAMDTAKSYTLAVNG